MLKLIPNCFIMLFFQVLEIILVLPFSFQALNNTMIKLSETGRTLEDYNYQNEGIADIILNEIADLQFKGMSVSPFIINFRNFRYRMSLIMGFIAFSQKREKRVFHYLWISYTR